MARSNINTKGGDTSSKTWNVEQTDCAAWGLILTIITGRLEPSHTWWFCVAACRLYTNSSWYCGSKVSITVSPLRTNRRPLDRGALSGNETHDVVYINIICWWCCRLHFIQLTYFIVALEIDKAVTFVEEVEVHNLSLQASGALS